MPKINKTAFRIKKRKGNPKDPNFDAQKFYNSYKWRRAAKAHRKDNPLCVVAEAEGFVEVGECVDHIIAIIHGGAKYDPRNFQTLTREAHYKKTKAETHGAVYETAENEDGDLIPVRDEANKLIPMQSIDK